MTHTNYINSLTDLKRHVSDICNGFYAENYGLTFDEMIDEFTQNLLTHLKSQGFKWGDKLPKISEETWCKITEIKYEDERTA